MGEKLSEAERAALAWCGDEFPRHHQGQSWGSPRRDVLNRLISKGLAEQVGEPSMDLFKKTPAGRAALPPAQGE